MSTSAVEEPLVRVQLKPSFDSSGAATSLFIQIHISSSSTEAAFPHRDPITATITPERSGGGLNRDHGGLVGVGRDFFPDVAAGFLSDAGKLRRRASAAIDWDLSDALPFAQLAITDYGERINPTDSTHPHVVRAVCSFGEGSHVRIDDVTFTGLLDCVYMVGPVQRYPPEHEQEEEKEEGRGVCRVYWLGSLPPNLHARRDFAGAMFPHLAPFFGDTAGAESYRLFFYKEATRGAGFRGRDLQGSGSSLVGYDDDSAGESDWEIVRLVTRQMVARWAWLDPEDDGVENGWYAGGLSNLYSIYLPYRFKHLPPDYFRATLNGILGAYFTSPLIDRPLREIAPSSWYTPVHAGARSCVYMIRTDAYTRRASRAASAGVMRPIDEAVAELCARRRRGENVQARDWLHLMGRWLGADVAQQSWREMMAGTPVMQLDDIRTAFDGIDEVRKEVLEFGFDFASLEAGVVRGLVPGSRAALAGLLDGDRIVWHSRPALCVTDVDAKFKVAVERDGQEVEIEYWPRSERNVRSWLSVKRES